MSDSKQDRFFDQRVVQRNVAAGRITKEEVGAFLGSLPDSTDNIRPREEGGDDDGYDRPRQSAANDGGRRPFFEHARPLYASASSDDDLDDDDLDDEDDDDLDDEDDDLDDDDESDEDDDDDEDDKVESGEGEAQDAKPVDAKPVDSTPVDSTPSIDDLFTPPEPTPQGGDDDEKS